MTQDKKTKIVATIGPATNSETTIRQLITAGVNVFRFNMKHGDIKWHRQTIKMVNRVAEEMHTTIATFIVLQGPELRIETYQHQDVTVTKDENLTICAAFHDEHHRVCLPHESAFKNLDVEDQVLIEDGMLEFTVVEKENNALVVRSHQDGVIKHRKGINFPGKQIDTPALIDDDLKKLDLAGDEEVDYLAFSFVRNKQDIDILKEEIKKRNLHAQIIAKIENQVVLDNIEEVVANTDIVMIARGDLGIEIPFEQLSFWQKKIVTMCRLHHKPVIVATQMLQSMIEAPMPTRAEASDVANAVYDGTDAVMLSGETATGKYPLKAVKAMSRIVSFTENNIDLPKQKFVANTQTELIIHAAMTMIKRYKEFSLDATVVLCSSGDAARILSSFRPKIPVIAVTDNRIAQRNLVLTYGVQAYQLETCEGKNCYDTYMQQLLDKQVITPGQHILIINHQLRSETTSLTFTFIQ